MKYAIHEIALHLLQRTKTILLKHMKKMDAPLLPNNVFIGVLEDYSRSTERVLVQFMIVF